MISVVNGYVCTSSCEVASAKQGRDPSAPPGSPPGVSGKDRKTSAFAGQAATVFDGSLKDIASANSDTTPSNVQQLGLDRLA